MSLETQSFEFGEFILDMKEKVLLCGGKTLSITPKAFELLCVLIENHGHLIEKNELIKVVWADSFVEEGNLTFTIRLLRKALGDDANKPRFIENVPKRGYRFVAEVTEISWKTNLKSIRLKHLLKRLKRNLPVRQFSKNLCFQFLQF